MPGDQRPIRKLGLGDHPLSGPLNLAQPAPPAKVRRKRERRSWIDFSGWRPDTTAMGVRTRGLDIKAGAAKLKADRAARLEAELVIDRWNRRLATGRDMLWSPTIRAALSPGRHGWMSSVRAAGRAGRSTCGPSTVIRWPRSVLWCLGCGAPGVPARRRCRSCSACTLCRQPIASASLYEDLQPAEID